MDKIADGLDPWPARRRLLEQLPCDFRKPVGLAVAAAEQIDECVRRQAFDRMLKRAWKDRIWQAAVANDAIGRKAHGAGRRNDTAAPIAEDIAIGRDRHRGAGGEEIGHDDIGRARKVRPQHHDHWRRLREIVQHFESDADLHSKYFPAAKVSRWL